MSPTASSTSIAPAQQPAHHMPLPTPVRNAPTKPSLQPCTMRANGARHTERQRRLSGVIWYATATATAISHGGAGRKKSGAANAVQTAT